jgi:phage-related protein
MKELKRLIYLGDLLRVDWYYDSRNRSQAREYFLALDDMSQAKLLALAKRLGDSGEIKDITKFRYEGRQIYALKVQIHRFLCFFAEDSRIIITNSYTKKSQKMPLKERHRALTAKCDYELRTKLGSYYDKKENF